MPLLDQQYVTVPTETLSQHPDNPRRGDVDAISQSIDAHGFYGALLVQRSTNYVLAGNHRLLAAIERDIPVLPVIYVDVDDEEAKRIVLIDNRVNDLAEYDNDALVELLQELGGDLSGTGYAEDDLAELIRRLDAGSVDPYAEWEGMPDYTNEKVAFQTLRVHFRNAEDRDAFAELMQQSITDKTRWLWVPAEERKDVKDLAYVDSPAPVDDSEVG
jgi:hypothetical protein